MLKSRRPENQRAQGMPGARCTRGLVCKMHVTMRTRAYRYSRSSPAFPARWFDGLCHALPGNEFLLPPSLCELTAKPEPGRANFAFAKLDTSHGCRDHTVLPYAASSTKPFGRRRFAGRFGIFNSLF